MIDQSIIENVTLVLHFDVNKTVFMHDNVQSLTTDHGLNAILSNCIWGVISEDLNDFGHKWSLSMSEPIFEPPADEKLITFGGYVEQNVHVMPFLKRLKYTFTEPGHEGEACRPHFLHLKTALASVSHSVISNSSSHVIHGSPSECHGIVSSFFRMMIELTRSEVDFRIIFRSFGRDVPALAKEFNSFCMGEHPEWPICGSSRSLQRMDGTQGSIDRRLYLPRHHGCIRRINQSRDGVLFAHIGDDQTVHVGTGAAQTWAILERWMEQGAYTIAIHDDFQYWSDHEESDSSGKLLLVDDIPPNLSTLATSSGRRRKRVRAVESNTEVPWATDSTPRTATRKVIQIFFDDNIERECAHIVDVRHRSTFEKIPFEVSKGYFLRRVEPYRVITEQLYFVDEIVKVLKMRSVIGLPQPEREHFVISDAGNKINVMK